MGFRRLSLMLRVPLVALFCLRVVYLGGDYPPDNYFASPDEVTGAFDELEDNKFLEKSIDAVLLAVIFGDTHNQHAEWNLLNFGYKPGATFDLHATGPPHNA